ncbi:MAG: GAF domain-containing protein [Cyanothece sp. SIO1E1]|nr:GAF domain-containing protein [Cyanothece sp. SIO1E1]
MGQSQESIVYERQLVALGRVLQTLREEEDVDVLIKTSLSYLQNEFEYALIWIGLYDRLGHTLTGKGGLTPTEDKAFLKQRLGLNPGDLLEQVVIQQRLVGVPDLREEPRAAEWRQAAQKFNIQGTIIFPLRAKTRCFGVALLGSHFWGVSPRSEEKARLSILFGSLAEALQQVENNLQQHQNQGPEDPLLSLLPLLRTLPNLDQRLQTIVEAAHQFTQPTRTNIYWFERERRYFWRRVSNQPKDKTIISTDDIQPAASGITAQEVHSFYQALAADQLVSVGEAHSSLKAGTTSRLMQQIRARSLLAAPILFQDELMGFLAIEGNEARLWNEAEKNYVRGAAQLIALTAPLGEMEATIKQIKLDQALTAGVSQAICSDDDWRATLSQCAAQICQRLSAERFLVMLYNADQACFEICYQSQPNNRRPIPSPLNQLNEVDWQMLEQATETVEVENLDHDLKLMAWRDAFLSLGVRSLLVCNTAIGNPLEGLVIIGHESPRTWTRSERELGRVVSQQIGLILHQWHLQRQIDQQQQLDQSIQWGLNIIQKMPQLDQLEHSAIQHIAQVLQVPLATLITWQPGRQAARTIATVCRNNKFFINSGVVIPVHSDAIIQWALQTNGLLPISADELPAETREWLEGPAIGQLLVMALRTAPEHEPNAVLLLADQAERVWPERLTDALCTLANQLAWSRRYLTLSETLITQRGGLEILNWYKHRRLEEVYRTLGANVKRLNELSHQKKPADGMHYQQILRQLGGVLTGITPLLKHEQWQLRSEYETMPLAGLLKRLLERADAMIKQRQLWSQVHNESNAIIGGDIIKIEFVLYELLIAACRRSPAGGRIDIWCRSLDTEWLEFSITDNGVIEPRLIHELSTGRPEDLLAPSTLDQPPGLNLAICQSLMQQIGGEFSLYKLEDERILSRVVMPIATSNSSSKGH